MPLNSVRSRFMPYCIQRQDDGSFLILNREYQPLGFDRSGSSNYSDYPIAVSIQGLTPRIAEKLSYKGLCDVSRIFLYNDSCIPTSSAKNMKAYLEKLEILMKLKLDDLW